MKITFGSIKTELQPIESSYLLLWSYSTFICEIRGAIKSLNLSLDNTLAWTTLMRGIENVQQISSDFVDANEKETLILLINAACELSGKFVKDEVFEKIWNEAKE